MVALDKLDKIGVEKRYKKKCVQKGLVMKL